MLVICVFIDKLVKKPTNDRDLIINEKFILAYLTVGR